MKKEQLLTLSIVILVLISLITCLSVKQTIDIEVKNHLNHLKSDNKTSSEDIENPMERKPSWIVDKNYGSDLNDTGEYRFHIYMIDPYIYINAYSQYSNDLLISLDKYGKTRWVHQFEGDFASYPAVSKDGDVFTLLSNESSEYLSLYAINDSGEVEWVRETEIKLTLAPIEVNKGYIFFCSNDTIFKYDTDGDLQSSKKVEGEISYLKVREDGMTYLIQKKGSSYNLISLNENMESRWDHSFSFPTSENELSICYFVNDEDFISIFQFEKPQKPTYGFTIKSISREGKERWNRTIWNRTVSSYIPTGGKIGCSDSDGNFYFISVDLRASNANNISLFCMNSEGEVVWNNTIYEGFLRMTYTGPKIGKDNNIYMGLVEGSYPHRRYLDFYSFTPNGKLRWNYSSENISYDDLPEVDSEGTLYLVSENGTVYAYGEEKEKPDNGNGIPTLNLSTCIFILLSTSMIYEIKRLDKKDGRGDR